MLPNSCMRLVFCASREKLRGVRAGALQVSPWLILQAGYLALDLAGLHYESAILRNMCLREKT